MIDGFYNVQEARSSIDTLIEDRIKKDPHHLMQIAQDTTAFKEAELAFDDNAQCWCLIHRAETMDAVDEMIFTTTGTLVAMDLPPILKENSGPEEIQISKDIDPKEILRILGGMNMMHTEDNEVSYFRRIINGGKKKYVKVKSQMFRIEDIVETQCLIVFVKCKGGGIRMKVILRALALINCDHTMNVAKNKRFEYKESKGPTEGKHRRGKNTRSREKDEEREEDNEKEGEEGEGKGQAMEVIK
ncbi:uncharacterized protein EV420DRAFT_1482935 [Desarmillaria tabescens]|uniref:Uncharacterized protein n=1 Tax=Armillaria tabescens TaxID=1929756 RepID=A0AA39JXL4_ARMTA|nr:uncharacterized protein EV420DRAFT_1482935 [Desarmillaria tabescens]KAK0450447.1 hypothetical protein EV420DRAFT_1482935 [Desarmillaria tabescens]